VSGNKLSNNLIILNCTHYTCEIFPAINMLPPNCVAFSDAPISNTSIGIGLKFSSISEYRYWYNPAAELYCYIMQSIVYMAYQSIPFC